MVIYDVIDLISENPKSHGVLEKPEEIRKTVYAEIRSVTRTEAYRAQSIGLDPAYVFVLSDYGEYGGEPFAEYLGNRYKIGRTYRAGQTIELTAVR